MSARIASGATGEEERLVGQAAALPLDPSVALAIPLGGSTFRALLVDREGKVITEHEIANPAGRYVDVEHAMAAVLISFGRRPLVGAAGLAGPIPPRGPLAFTNLPQWGEFDRRVARVFGIELDWLNDGPAGWAGLQLLDPTQFDTLLPGSYQPGDPYAYAIFGTGLNLATSTKGREDAHGPFAPSMYDSQQISYMEYLLGRLGGREPDWEDACSGGDGFRRAGEFKIAQQINNVFSQDPFCREFSDTAEKDRGKVVTKFALEGDPVAGAAAKLVFDIFGRWLGAMIVGSQVTRVDLCPGVLRDPQLQAFCLESTDFVTMLTQQCRPSFSDYARQCTVRVCRENPERLGVSGRAAELLRATA